ncbi:MAG: acetyl-CoA C-acetyltransferase [Bacteroidales bacterium]|nr:acetyl-CoA C-acetyltransferase [Bacteroidales bacterium]
MYLLSAVRTPIGKFLGDLADQTAPQLGSVAVAEALRRANVPPERVDEVLMGNVVQAGIGQAPARQVALLAGVPDTVSALTVNMVCGSGLRAVMLAAGAIRAGDADIIVAGGMESMSNAPYLLPGARKGMKYGDQPTVDALVKDGLWCAFENWGMGEAAEHIASRCGIGRAEQDAFSAESHRRAAAAWDRGMFTAEIVPVTVGRGPKARTVANDGGIRPDTTTESLAKLRPAFRPEGGTVTAGNASQLSDGAAAVVVASEAAMRQLGTPPLARIVAYAVSGVPPKEIFVAPVAAIRSALAKAHLPLEAIDLWELNEAFAAQMLACTNALQLDPEKVNVHGGAVALGHPLGASGARVLVTLVHALHARQQRYGLASLCLGGGNAVAMIVERV